MNSSSHDRTSRPKKKNWLLTVTSFAGKLYLKLLCQWQSGRQKAIRQVSLWGSSRDEESEFEFLVSCIYYLSSCLSCLLEGLIVSLRKGLIVFLQEEPFSCLVCHSLAIYSELLISSASAFHFLPSHRTRRKLRSGNISYSSFQIPVPKVVFSLHLLLRPYPCCLSKAKHTIL